MRFVLVFVYAPAKQSKDDAGPEFDSIIYRNRVFNWAKELRDAHKQDQLEKPIPAGSTTGNFSNYFPEI